MFDQIKRISKSTVIYSIGQIAPKLVGLILLPFFTNIDYLSAEDYGKLSILEASAAFLTTLFGFGLNYALERWYYDKEWKDSRRSIFFTLVITTLFFTALFAGLLSLFPKSISMLLTGREEWKTLLILLFYSAALESLILLPLTLLRLEEKPVLFVSSNVFRFALYLVLTLLFLISYGRGLEGIYIARAASSTGILLLLSIYLFRNIKVKIEWKALKDMILFRLPLVLSTLSYVIFNITDRFSLRFLSGSSFTDVGIYSLGFSIVNSVKLVILSAIWLSLRPVIYKMIDEPGNKRFYSKIMKYMAFCVVFLLLCVTAFGQEAILIFASSDIYNPAFYLIPIISLALIFDTLKEISQAIGLNIVKKTGVMAITMIIATVINIGMNILLIPHLHIYGAALSTVVSQVFFFTVIYHFAQKYYRVPYEIGRIMIMILVFVVLGGAAMLTSSTELIIRIPLKIIIVSLFPVILYFTGFFEQIEIARIKSLWKKVRNPAELIKAMSRD